jgi:hypothetical protein
VKFFTLFSSEIHFPTVKFPQFDSEIHPITT